MQTRKPKLLPAIWILPTFVTGKPKHSAASENQVSALLEEILKQEEYTYQTYFQLLTANQIQWRRAEAKEQTVKEINSAAFIE